MKLNATFSIPFLATLLVTTLATTLAATPVHAAVGANLCAEAFTPATTKPLTSREKLVELGRVFAATPEAERATLRHPEFTASAKDVLHSLAALYRKSGPALNKVRRAEFALATDYIRRLERETARALSQGDVDATWAHELGFHAGYIADLVKNGTTLITMVLKPAVDTYAHSSEPDIRGYALDLVFQKLAEHSSFARHQGFVQIPTTRMYSLEGMVELMAYGIHTNGLFISDPSPADYARHDFDHDRVFVRSFYDLRKGPFYYFDPLRDIGQIPAYQRFKIRLQNLVTQLKKLPEQERHAGFAILFYMVHEDGSGYLRDLGEEQLTTERIKLITEGARLNSVSLIADVKDMGVEFAQKKMFRTQVVPDPKDIAKRGADVVRDALEMLNATERF